MKMQMSENDLERVSIKKFPVYILFLFIFSGQAFLGIFLWQNVTCSLHQ